MERPGRRGLARETLRHILRLLDARPRLADAVVANRAGVHVQTVRKLRRAITSGFAREQSQATAQRLRRLLAAGELGPPPRPLP